MKKKYTTKDIYSMNGELCHDTGVLVDEITYRREKQIDFLFKSVKNRMCEFEYRKKPEWARIIYYMLKNEDIAEYTYARQVALHTGINPKIIHRYIVELDNRKYITKHRIDNNKKVIYLQLTDKARCEAAAYSQLTDEIMQNVHDAALSKEDEIRLFEAYKTINELTSKLNDYIDTLESTHSEKHKN